MSRHFLIDGYNVIRQISSLDDKSLEGGRAWLVRFIQDNGPQGSLRNPVTVVFDGQEGISFSDFPSGVKVVFSRGESADDVIKRLIEESSTPRDIVLVTDDRDLLYFCRTLGAEIWSVDRFLTQGKKTGQRLRSGVARSRSPKVEGKAIPRVFEDRVNRELKALWLKKK
ncbi:MAG: NYN domain-containing protein [Candidatus Omnitrophica bacterium]|nr:NYN domain-containing protein [Candidatus Omnitrophota bacterium]